MLKFAHQQRCTSGAGLETGGGDSYRQKYTAPVFEALRAPIWINFILPRKHGWFLLIRVTFVPGYRRFLWAVHTEPIKARRDRPIGGNHAS